MESLFSSQPPSHYDCPASLRDKDSCIVANGSVLLHSVQGRGEFWPEGGVEESFVLANAVSLQTSADRTFVIRNLRRSAAKFSVHYDFDFDPSENQGRAFTAADVIRLSEKLNEPLNSKPVPKRKSRKRPR